jgi:hypothetical protein
MSKEKDIYELNIHESTNINLGSNPALANFGFDDLNCEWNDTVLKVHKGWIYIGLDDNSPVFVPDDR